MKAALLLPLLLPLWLALLAGCAQMPAAAPGAGVRAAAATEHRVEFSRPSSLGVVAIPAVEAHLQATLQRLLSTSAVPAGAPATVRVAIAAAPVTSAWATEDALYVPWRLLSLVDSDDELAALLAHEASHVLLRHAALDARTSLFGALSAFGPLLVAGTPLAAVAVMVGGQYGDRALAAGWAREQELEADALGLRLLAAAGYRPSAMLDLLDDLDSLNPRSGRVRPGPVTQEQQGLSTQTTINLGALRFGEAEDSHPDMDTRRDQVRRLVQAGLPVPTAAPPAPAMPWPQLLRQPEVRASMLGLAAALQALAASAGVPLPAGADPQALARGALASPIGSSFLAYWAAASVLPGDVQRALGLPPLSQRLQQADTPVIAFLALLAYTAKRGDWSTACDVADLLRERFEPDRGLYRQLAKVYGNRAQQVAAYVAANINQLGAGQSLSLNGERVKRELQASKMLLLCAAAARSPNDIAGSCQ